jgi:AcrR family transcriptional regulator
MKKDGSQTRENIIDKSLQIFSVKGYHNTSISDILAETGLTKGGLYGHFRSKEELWEAAYEKALEIWKGIVFRGVREVPDPLDRIEKAVENDLLGYVGAGIFAGGCFFFNMLVELSGQSEPMSRRIRGGIEQFAGLIAYWLEEANKKGMLKPGVSPRHAADFIVIAINGAAALYAAGRDPAILETTLGQLRGYIRQMRSTN